MMTSYSSTKNSLKLLFLVIISAYAHLLPAQSTVNELIKKSESSRKLGNYQAAITLLKDALNSDLSVNDSLLALVQHKLAVNYYMTDQFAEATTAITTALDIRKSANLNQVDLARSLYLSASIKRYTHELAEAKSQLLEAIHTIEYAESMDSTQKAVQLGRYFTELGIIYKNLGDYYQALNCWKEAETYYLQLQSSRYNLAYLTEREALVRYYLKEYDLATTRFDEARQILEESPEQNLNRLAALYNNFGLTLQKQQKRIEAKALFERSLEIYLKQSRLANALNIIPNLIKINHELGNRAKAEYYFDTYFPKIPEYLGTSYHPLSARFLWYKAESATHLPLQNRLQLLQQAIHMLVPDCSSDNINATPRIHENLIVNRAELLTPLQLKAAWLQQQAGEQDQDLLLLSIQTSQAMDTLITTLRQDYQVAESKFFLQEQAQKIYQDALLASLQLYNNNKEQRYLEQAYRFAAQHKAIVLLEGMQNLKAKEISGIPDSLITRERQLQQSYYLLEQNVLQKGNATTNTDSLTQQLLKTRRAYQQLVKRIETHYPRYYQLKYAPIQTPALNTLQKQLPENSVLLEYFTGPDIIAIFTLTQDRLDVHTFKRPQSFATVCQTFRKSCSSFEGGVGLQNLEQSGQQLYQWLVKTPLSKLSEQYKHLIIIPDGALLSLAFEAFPTNGRSRPYLLENYSISYYYSNRLLDSPKVNQQLRWAQKGFLGFGLEYDDSMLKRLADIEAGEQERLNEGQRAIGKLEYSDDEVLAIQHVLGGEVLLNWKATKAAFLQKAPDYRILHLAMHGVVDIHNPMFSSLVFAPTSENNNNHLLYAADIYNMHLPANQMVVLSACNTGYGQLRSGEGIRSISRAFFHAGSPSLIASLWGAPDQATKDITTRFYQLLKKGQSKDQALRQAKLEFLSSASPAYQHPAYWSHLVAIGDISPLKQKKTNLFVSNRKLLLAAAIGVLLSIFFIFWAKKK